MEIFFKYSAAQRSTSKNIAVYFLIKKLFPFSLLPKCGQLLYSSRTFFISKSVFLKLYQARVLKQLIERESTVEADDGVISFCWCYSSTPMYHCFHISETCRIRMSSASSFNSILSYDGSTDDPDYFPSGGETECFFELDLDDDETMDDARKKSCSSNENKSDECRGKKSAETVNENAERTESHDATTSESSNCKKPDVNNSINPNKVEQPKTKDSIGESDDDLDPEDFLAMNKNKNSKRGEKSAVGTYNRVIKDFCAKKGLNYVSLEDSKTESLPNMLLKFFQIAKMKSGKVFSSGSFHAMYNGLARYILDSRDVDIKKDPSFHKVHS